MRQKKRYEQPDLTIVSLNDDMIRTSGETDGVAVQWEDIWTNPWEGGSN